MCLEEIVGVDVDGIDVGGGWHDNLLRLLASVSHGPLNPPRRLGVHRRLDRLQRRQPLTDLNVNNILC